MRESNPLNLFFSFVPGLVITIKLPLRRTLVRLVILFIKERKQPKSAKIPD